MLRFQRLTASDETIDPLQPLPVTDTAAPDVLHSIAHIRCRRRDQEIFGQDERSDNRYRVVVGAVRTWCKATGAARSLTLPEMGLSQIGLRDSVANLAHADRVRSAFMGGVRSGVNGTFFINGVRHDGGFSAPELSAAVEHNLAATR